MAATKKKNKGNRLAVSGWSVRQAIYHLGIPSVFSGCDAKIF
jgi:hypothetical protein